MTHLKHCLNKANKKIQSIELAKGFDKCNDELLDKWEKIFTNWLVEVSKEKGRRETQSDCKKLKAELKKVLKINKELKSHIQIYSDSRNIKDPISFEKSYRKDEESGILMHNTMDINFDGYKTTANFNKEVMNDRTNMYHTTYNNDTRYQSRIKNEDFNSKELSTPLLGMNSNLSEDNLCLNLVNDKNNNDSPSSQEEQDKTVRLDRSREEQSKHGKRL